MLEYFQQRAYGEHLDGSRLFLYKTTRNFLGLSGDTGAIAFPAPQESVVGGHAVMAVGYDDTIQIPHPTTGAETTGALRIRNSWGGQWGEAGYGWLPYDYVLTHLGRDFWMLTGARWVDTGAFDR